MVWCIISFSTELYSLIWIYHSILFIHSPSKGYLPVLAIMSKVSVNICVTIFFVCTQVLWCWRSLLRVLWTARRSNQSILKEINPEYSLEGLMLKLKLQDFGHLMQRADSLEKTLMLGKMEGKRRKGQQDEMVGWHHQLNGHEFEQTPGDSEGQGSLACCNPWGCKESDMT